ncbi:MAG: HAD hydrolase-like protein, partial [Parvularculaceae bacterium]|nr:HAD hydrolase-like protein [Parvularculaceae bacterium]
MERLDGCVCIFDLDGTLVDSAPDLIGALNRLLVREGLAPMTTSTVRPIVGEGARAMIRKAFDAQGKLPSLEGREDTLVAE